MNGPLKSLVAAMLVFLVMGCGHARAELMIVGIDNKFAFDQDGKRQALAPGHDELVVFDLADPSRPTRVGSLPLENSVVGPPTNLAVTPNGRLALIANSLHSEPAEVHSGWRSVPADELFVVDLVSRPPRLISTIKVGAQPSGLAIDRTGTLALVANREGKSISVLRISGDNVTLTDTIAIGDVVASVAITPDGRHALAAKFAVSQGRHPRHRARRPGELLRARRDRRSLALYRGDYSRRSCTALTSDTGNLGNFQTETSTR